MFCKQKYDKSFSLPTVLLNGKPVKVCEHNSMTVAELCQCRPLRVIKMEVITGVRQEDTSFDQGILLGKARGTRTCVCWLQNECNVAENKYKSTQFLPTRTGMIVWGARKQFVPKLLLQTRKWSENSAGGWELSGWKSQRRRDCETNAYCTWKYTMKHAFRRSIEKIVDGELREPEEDNGALSGLQYYLTSTIDGAERGQS